MKWLRDFIKNTFGNVRNLSTLDDDITAAVAKHYPASITDIKAAFRLLKSWDTTIELCEFTVYAGYSSPYHSIGMFIDSHEGQTFRMNYRSVRQWSIS